MSNTLKEVVEKLNEAKEMANMDLGDHPWQTRPGMEMRKAQAKRDVETLGVEYRKALQSSVAKLFIEGSTDNIKKFSKLLEKEGVTVFYVDSLYENIATVVQPTLSLGNSFSSAAFMRLVEMVGTFARAHGIIPHTNLVEPVGVGVNSLEELTNVVRDVVRNAFGDNLNKAYLYGNVVNIAFDRQFSGDLAVLVIKSSSSEEQSSLTESLFPGQPSFSLTMEDDESPDKSLALKIYRKMSETLTKSNKTLTNKTDK